MNSANDSLVCEAATAGAWKFQVYSPDTSGYSEVRSAVTHVAPDQWVTAEVEVPFPASGLRLDPVNQPSLIEISEIIIRDPSGDVIWRLEPGRSDEIVCGGTAFRVPGEGPLTVFSYGGDPQLYLPRFSPAEQTRNVWLYCRFRAESGFGSFQEAFQKYSLEQTRTCELHVARERERVVRERDMVGRERERVAHERETVAHERETVAALQHEVTALAHDIDSFRSSMSWRLTAPLRMLARPLLRSPRRGSPFAAARKRPALASGQTHDAHKKIPDAVFTNEGYCCICDQETQFVATHEWFRDFYICTRCGTCPRQRATAEVLSRVAPNWRRMSIHESSPCIDFYAQQCPGYTRSYYFEDAELGSTQGGLRCENLEKLTFPDETFDVFLTQDVLEHVFRPDLAVREIARVLKPGGVHVFTTPKHKHLLKSCPRARQEDSGRIEHLLPPEYHGNPIADGRSLVTWDYGADFDDLVSEWSGYQVSDYVIRDRARGIDAEYLDVFVMRRDENNRVPR
jgi:SAM-dependent methyltransferase